MLTTPENLAAEILKVCITSAAVGMGEIQRTLKLKRDLAVFYRELSDSSDPLFARHTDKEWNKKEYLIDFCVIGKDHRMDTAIECEWTPTLKKIEEDFEKLLHVKAPLKVMICDSPQYVTGKLQPAVKFLSNRHQAITPGETFMIFNWRGGRAVANCHVWTPTESFAGRLEDIKFQCLTDFPAKVSDRCAHPNDGWLGELGE